MIMKFSGLSENRFLNIFQNYIGEMALDQLLLLWEALINYLHLLLADISKILII